MVTAELSRFLAKTNLADIPDAVRKRAKYVILDGIACGLVGAKLPWSIRAVEAMCDLEGTGTATIWGWERKVPPQTAALLNGTFVQGFELDDYHQRGPLHSASVVLTAALATAEQMGGIDGKRLLEAVILGFEAGPRVGMALGGSGLINRGWHCGSVFGTMSSAVGAGKVRGLSAEAFEDALGITATQACGLMSAQFEAMVKRMNHGFSARNGVVAAALAARGFTGAKGVIERDFGGLAGTFCPGEDLDLNQLTDELGERWEVLQIAIKPPYACMGGLHSTIESVDILRARNKYEIADLERVDVRVTDVMMHHGGWKLERPGTEIGAQMNSAYAAAVTLLDGTPTLPQFSARRINSDDIWELLPKVHVHPNPEVEALGIEAQWGSSVTIHLRGGKSDTAQVLYQWGCDKRPLTDDEIVAKFDRLMGLVMERSQAERLKSLAMELESVRDVGVLAEALGKSVGPPYPD